MHSRLRVFKRLSEDEKEWLRYMLTTHESALTSDEVACLGSRLAGERMFREVCRMKAIKRASAVAASNQARKKLTRLVKGA